MTQMTQRDGYFTRRSLLKLCATIAGPGTLIGRFRFLKSDPRNMLKPRGHNEPVHKVQTKTEVPAKTHIAVIGAGAFGGWTALYLLRRGARVSMVDAWGPGNSRASSGGETRVIRGTYGPDQPYTK